MKVVYDIATGKQTEAELTPAEISQREADEAAAAAALANQPPRPDYASDDTPAEQIADGVTQLRAYLALANPTAAQSAAALKLTIRGLLFVLRRVF